MGRSLWLRPACIGCQPQRAAARGIFAATRVAPVRSAAPVLPMRPKTPQVHPMQQKLFDFIGRYMVLTEEEKSVIGGLDIFRTVKKGTILLNAGERSRDSYFVLEGCIRTFYVVDGEERTTAFYTEMEALTPVCVVSRTPSEYTISCVEDTILSISDADLEVDVNSRFPRFETLCKVLSEELLAKERTDFDAFKTSSPEERYLNLLRTRPDLVQRVPQHQLASYLGITPQSLSRLRARLIEKERS